MGYYRGDYYRGDYYQGGFLASIGKAVGKFGGSIGKTAAKLVPGGGLVVTAAQLASNAFSGGGRPKATASTPGAIKDPGLGGIISRLLPGGMTGYHRRRRMNVTNPKALRRAIRRAHGFAKLARSVMTFPIQKPPKGRALFKKRARSR